MGEDALAEIVDRILVYDDRLIDLVAMQGSAFNTNSCYSWVGIDTSTTAKNNGARRKKRRQMKSG
jgi:hypothetical protein